MYSGTTVRDLTRAIFNAVTHATRDLHKYRKMKDISIMINDADNDNMDLFDVYDERDGAKSPHSSVSHTGVMVRDTLTNISYIRPDGNVSDAVIVVIPGNPGAIGFYDKFIEYLFQIYEIPIYGVSYAGESFVYTFLSSFCNFSCFDTFTFTFYGFRQKFSSFQRFKFSEFLVFFFLRN